MRLLSSRSALVLCFYGSLCFSGCTALVSPYSSTFQCPNTNKGKCVSVTRAYDESVDNNPLVKEKPPCPDCEKQEKDSVQEARPQSKSDDLKYRYQDSLYKKLASLISQPETPLVEPPEVMRVLILSYTGSDNELFSYRYAYFFATEPKWIISTGKEED